MVMGFKDQFCDFVEDGSKTHSIRGGERWRVGMRVDAFARPRQKGMRLLGRWLCVKVERIQIRHGRTRSVAGIIGDVVMTIDGLVLSTDEKNFLAWKDGFRKVGVSSFELMMRFWKGRLPFKGQIIHWRYSKIWEKPSTSKARRKRSKTKSSSRSVKRSGAGSRTSRSCPKSTKRTAE